MTIEANQVYWHQKTQEYYRVCEITDTIYGRKVLFEDVGKRKYLLRPSQFKSVFKGVRRFELVNDVDHLFKDLGET